MTLILDSSLQSCETINFCCLSHSVCDTLLQQPYEVTCSVAKSCPILCDPPWTAACQASLSFTISWSLLKLMSIELMMPSNYFILCHPLLLLPSVFPNIRVFSNESALPIMWPKYWSFSLSISPFNECLGLISFSIDWLDLLAVQGTLKSSPTPHFKSINSLVLSFLYGPILTSKHDYWKNQSFDYTNLCWQSDTWKPVHLVKGKRDITAELSSK